MRKERQTIEFYENRCCVCLTPFWQEGDGRLRRTCSHACRQKLYRMRHPERRSIRRKARRTDESGDGLKTCVVCGKEIRQRETGRRRKTCSDACRKRLWRLLNPHCATCGKRFKRAARQPGKRYCSEQCRWKMENRRRWQRELERRRREMGSYRPEWMPRKGSGYRQEVIPWEGNEAEAVVRRRRAYPNRRRGEWWEEEDEAAREEARLRQVEEEMAREAAREVEEEAAAEEAWRAAQKAAEEARRAGWLRYELLEDESKWREW